MDHRIRTDPPKDGLERSAIVAAALSLKVSFRRGDVTEQMPFIHELRREPLW
jgi:hypothetical protein